MKAIADTGFLVAFGSRRDTHHRWALSLAGRVTEPLLTCEAVLAETAFHLEDASYVISLVAKGLVRVAFDFTSHEPELARLAAKYAARKPDIADLCLIRMSEMYREFPVITTDLRDFSVYRRNKRERIPLITPGA